MTPHLAKTSNAGSSNEDNWSPWRKLKKRENGMTLKDNRYDLYAVCYHQVIGSLFNNFYEHTSILIFFKDTKTTNK